MSSTRSRRWLGIAAAASAVLVAGLWTALAVNAPSAGPGTGSALDGDVQGGMEVISPHARPGSEYWVSLPAVANTSDEPLALLKGEITRVPEGLEILEYRAVSAEDTDGHPMIVPTGGRNGMPDLAKIRDYAGRPVRVPAREVSDIFYAARVRVTGPVRGDLTGCRYWYRQGNKKFRQDLGCVTRIRLGKPLKVRD